MSESPVVMQDGIWSNSRPSTLGIEAADIKLRGPENQEQRPTIPTAHDGRIHYSAQSSLNPPPSFLRENPNQTMPTCKLSSFLAPKPQINTTTHFLSPQSHPTHHVRTPKISNRPSIKCSLRELRERMNAVKNTQKITEAMKLVSAAKIRRAQEAVISSRPFSQTLVEVLYSINEQLQSEDIDIPLTAVRPVKKVALLVITSDKGLCGGFNSSILRKAETRIQELKSFGLDYAVISVGKKGNSYFIRRPDVDVDKFVEGLGFPTTKEAQVIADYIFSLFVSEEVDKVEILYTKFVSFLKSEPVIQGLLPLSAKGVVSDGNGNCVDAIGDEFFRLTTKEGKLSVERDKVKGNKKGFLTNMEFEQDPVQILDAMMPLYLNNQILRALQESLASELAARMNAMKAATDNASDLKKNLSSAYNRGRQAKITSEILEIAAAAETIM